MSTSKNRSPVVSRDIELPSVDVVQSFLRTAKHNGWKSILQQITDIIRLRFSNARMGTSEYYYYRLFEQSLSAEDKSHYVGWRKESEIKPLITSAGWQALVQDKILFNTICRGLGLPVAKQVALYHPAHCPADMTALPTSERLKEFLAEEASYPLFGKPWRSDRSRGVADLVAFDSVRKEMVLGNDTTIGIDEFVSQVSAFKDIGYLFEERLKPHEHIQAISGPTLSTFRIILLLRRGLPEVYRAAWKIPVGKNMADNFWRDNLLGDIDKVSGKVQSVIRGVGINTKEIDKHPDSGLPLKNFVIPDWSALVDLCMQAAPAFWGIKMQAYDVALSSNGPVLVEMNVCGDMNLPQLSSQKGLLDEQFQSFLEEETLPLKQRDHTLK